MRYFRARGSGTHPAKKRTSGFSIVTLTVTPDAAIAEKANKHRHNCIIALSFAATAPKPPARFGTLRGSATGGCGEGQISTHCWANARISQSGAPRDFGPDFGPNLSPGVAQSDGAVEHEPASCRVRIGAEIALPLELHDLAGLLFDQHRLDAGLA